MKKKNLLFIIYIFLLVCSIISFNFFVDPYNLFFLKSPILFMNDLPRDLFYISLKAYKSVKSDTLVMGSSETIGMFSLAHFKNDFNFVAVDGIDYSQYYDIIDNYLKLHPETKNVYIFLNYVCLFQDKLSISYLPSFNSKNITIKELARVLLSFDALLKSLNVVISQFKEKNSSLFPSLPSTKIFYNQIDLINEGMNNYDFSALNERNINSLKRLILLLENKNINFTFVIPPYSAVYLSIIDEYNNLQSQVEQFKRWLVSVLPASTKIYDFAFVNKYSSLPLHKGNEVYYYNCTHPNIYWGAKLHRIFFNVDNLCDDDRKLFFILNMENIEKVLITQKIILSDYKRSNRKTVDMYKKRASSCFNDTASREINIKNYSPNMIYEHKYLDKLLSETILSAKKH